MKPIISIIVPVYNTEKYLQDCVDSLINQTMAEIEIIFVNDASPDGCLNILQENQRKYADKIKIIDSKENLKQGGARNLGLRIARGEYVLFVDSDDFVAPNICERMYQRMIEKDADVCWTQLARVAEQISYSDIFAQTDNRTLERNIMEKFSVTRYLSSTQIQKSQKWDSANIIDENRADFIAYDFISVGGSLWKKGLIINNAIWFPEYLKFEDNYWIRLAKCYVKKCAFLNEIAYFYRSATQSTVHAKNEPYYWDRITVMNLLVKDLKDRNLFEKYYTAWEYICIINCYNTYFTFMHKFDKPPAKLVKKITKECLKEYPEWKKNLYYRLSVAKSRRFKYALINRMPIVMLYIHPLLEKIAKKDR